MKKLILFLALFLCAFTTTAAHAAGITYDFELAHLVGWDDLNDPSTFILAIGKFSLDEGTKPSGYYIEPPFGVYDMYFSNVPMTVERIEKGVVTYEREGIGTVVFYRDMIGMSSSSIEFSVNNVPPPIDWSDPNNPIFKTGYVYNSNFSWYEVTAQTPEPSSLILLGSGALGLVGVFRRRLVNL